MYVKIDDSNHDQWLIVCIREYFVLRWSELVKYHHYLPGEKFYNYLSAQLAVVIDKRIIPGLETPCSQYKIGAEILMFQIYANFLNFCLLEFKRVLLVAQRQ